MFTDYQSRLPRVLLLLSLVAAAALVRQLSHPQNFTPVGALAIFAGACFADRRLAVLVPLAALVPGDLAAGMHVLVPAVYGSLALNVLLARRLRKGRTAASTAAVTLLGAVQFFVTTNFATWLVFYPHTLGELVSCYVAAVPYFRNTLLGDATFVALLFGALALAERALPAVREPVPAAAN
ncbi:hypothetical protein R5W23_002439 [Gemmata sp. JC673]|uniref:ECF transporter S component n=1 Tax=Gemmata algarum TaxID=2975278 RepID=A0ABU5F2Y0_9BACT|nr:DUF6580 family putative transport protein [Gemmata algarum]MDY3561177.1 hypothetical protein [Gemmata algarum]